MKRRSPPLSKVSLFPRFHRMPFAVLFKWSWNINVLERSCSGTSQIFLRGIAVEEETEEWIRTAWLWRAAPKATHFQTWNFFEILWYSFKMHANCAYRCLRYLFDLIWRLKYLSGSTEACLPLSHERSWAVKTGSAMRDEVPQLWRGVAAPMRL